MKKFLLSAGLFSLVLVGKAQTVLNEVYTEPGNTHQEFFELYNSAVGSQSVDCFTVLTYFDDASGRGWYVLDLPNLMVGPKGFFVGASSNPFNTQSTTGSIPDFSWNDPAFRSGSTGGSLTKWILNAAGTGYTSAAVPANLNDLLPKTSLAGPTYLTLVYVGGSFNNAFYGGGASGVLPAAITTLPNLPVTMNAACGNFVANFSTIGPVEFVNSAPGNDNGYARTSDGKCGAWVKTSSSVNHTPGVTNGGAAGLAGALVTAPEVLQCNTGPGVSKVTYNITGVSGDASEAADFPVEIQLYYDHGTLGQLDGADVYSTSLFDAAIADPAKTFTIVQNQPVILVYKTKRGCFDKVVAIANGCAPLPVSFTSFTASRSHSNVMVKWSTAWEQNNSGFAVERNINGTWEQVAFVASQGTNGNSTAALDYQFIDLNNTKGVTQYRIKQIDLDAKSKYSEIRAVRGENQLGKVIVYPNPSNDGKVNIVFEDANISRDIAVSDMSGRTVKQLRGVTNNNITIENLTPGMYSLRIVVPATGDQTVEKIVVNKR